MTSPGPSLHYYGMFLPSNHVSTWRAKFNTGRNEADETGRKETYLWKNTLRRSGGIENRWEIMMETMKQRRRKKKGRQWNGGGGIWTMKKEATLTHHLFTATLPASVIWLAECHATVSSAANSFFDNPGTVLPSKWEIGLSQKFTLGINFLLAGFGGVLI